MTADKQPPLFPFGEYSSPGEYDEQQRSVYLQTLVDAPAKLRKSVAGLDDQQLDTKYKNWTVRQIVHHLADSHMNALIRIKWALTEDSPLIKCYNETAWSEVVDARTLPIEPSLTLLDGLHVRLAKLLELLDEDQLKKTYFHPEIACDVLLHEVLPQYVWHGEHHTAQIDWMREKHSF